MVLSGREAQFAPVRELVSRLAPLTDTSETQAARWFRRAVMELVSNISSDLQSTMPTYDLNTAIILVTEELGRLTEEWMNKTESFAEWCALQRALNSELGCVPERFVLPATEGEPERASLRALLGLSAEETLEVAPERWEELARRVDGADGVDVEVVEELVGEGMELARAEVEPLLMARLSTLAHPEPAREIMLALLDFDIAPLSTFGEAATPWLRHQDRSVFTTALQVVLRSSQAPEHQWSELRPTLSEDRQRIGDKLLERMLRDA
jgi:hypothetical protein